jgi:hypothetical protein
LKVPNVIGEIALQQVPELRGFRDELRMSEVPRDAFHPPVKLVDVRNVNGSDGIRSLLGATGFGSPRPKELTEASAAGLPISGGGAHGVDESPDDTTTENANNELYPFWVHIIGMVIGGACGALMMEWFRWKFSAEQSLFVAPQGAISTHLPSAPDGRIP